MDLRWTRTTTPGRCGAPRPISTARSTCWSRTRSLRASGTAVTVAARPGALEVLDEGPGLAPGEEHEVFERFHRGRAGRTGSSGTGLGLAIAAELAGEWNGSATLANRPTGGLRARLELPSRE